jgi:cobalt transporter subunit CbtA
VALRRFRQLLLTAASAGVLSGLFAAVGHQLGTVPLIVKAEAYEKAARGTAEPPHAVAARGTDPGAALAPQGRGAVWEPRDGLERAAYTLVADVVTSFGFALLLAAALSLRGAGVGNRQGLCWGLAGFAVFTLAPGLGLPPELPGSAAAPLLERQLWWAATALATAGGLAALFLCERALVWLGGIALLVLPHLYGALQPSEHPSVAPESLAQRFGVAVTVVSFLFWLVLGAASAYFYRFFADEPPAAERRARASGT